MITLALIIQILVLIAATTAFAVICKWMHRKKLRVNWSLPVLILLFHYILYVSLSMYRTNFNLSILSHQFLIDWAHVLRFHTVTTILSIAVVLNSLNGKVDGCSDER